jgi:hypothetical protein
MKPRERRPARRQHRHAPARRDVGFRLADEHVGDADAVGAGLAIEMLLVTINGPFTSTSIICSSRSNYFFANAMQGMMYGGSRAGDKPAGYRAPVLVEGSGSGVE